MAPAPKSPLARGDACQSCKARKVRCPAERPACSRCTKRKRDCVYINSPMAAESSDPSPQSPLLSHNVSPPVASASGSAFSTITAPTSLSVPAPPTVIDPASALAPATDTLLPTYDPPWTDDYFKMVGMVPSTAGNEQTFPSHWENFDLSVLLGQSNEAGFFAEELTAAERDHLLLLYFTNQRIFGLDMHIATFYNKLQSPDPAIRPHPCLLNAMYLVTCRASPVQSLRQRENVFLNRAKEAMDRAVGEDRRLFDAMRAGTLMTAWFYGKERHAEGWAMQGQTVHERELRRGLGLYLPPAETNLELADRIYAFWAIFMVDRCATIAFEWPAGFDIDCITTPLPRSWSEYETGDPHLGTCDERPSEVLTDKTSTRSCPIDHRTDLGHIVKALTLMHQASLRPAPPQQALLADAIKRFVISLPDALKQTAHSMDGKRIVEAGTATLMFLYSIDADLRPDPRALKAAKRILGVLHLLQDANVGDVNLFIIVIWTRTCRLMIWESKRLEAEGETFAAASYARDVEAITSFMSQMKHINLAADALREIDQWWISQAEDFQYENDTARKNRRKLSR
ncbi:hypothetical protein IAR55_005612 [Kwoniella newhampshirensis]|uniref:Zn(2)-C6 fungal-type domain-containing protein n=1 Tax=Kwoniella newhampshirensis TaxID=1651941 RepID=A0AAW0YSK4_9TREE